MTGREVLLELGSKVSEAHDVDLQQFESPSFILLHTQVCSYPAGQHNRVFQHSKLSLI